MGRILEPEIKVNLHQFGSFLKPSERKKRVGTRVYFSRCFGHETNTLNVPKRGDPIRAGSGRGKLWRAPGVLKAAASYQERVLGWKYPTINPPWQALWQKIVLPNGRQGSSLASRSPFRSGQEINPSFELLFFMTLSQT